MSSDNFDLEDDTGRVWANLSASSFLDLSPEAMVVLVDEFYEYEHGYEYSDYTEYGVSIAGPISLEHRVEALTYIVKDLWSRKK